jgi:hypothetical protein
MRRATPARAAAGRLPRFALGGRRVWAAVGAMIRDLHWPPNWRRDRSLGANYMYVVLVSPFGRFGRVDWGFEQVAGRAGGRGGGAG